MRYLLLLVLLAGVLAQDQPDRTYVALYGQGPKWVAGTRVDRQPGIAAHAAYMVKLFRQGKLRVGGPFLDDSGGMTVFVAKNDEAANAIVHADPAIKSGIMKLTVLRPWHSVNWTSFAKRVAGKEELARQQCKDYYDKAKIWQLMKKEMPASLQDLEAPLREGEERFLKLKKDPWGNAYALKANGRKFRVISPGLDGQLGTDDDISYPPED